LMDEAFSALDPLIRSGMQGQLIELQKTLHKTILFITHDLDEALRLGDQIAILNHGELVQNGTAEEIILNPADDYVADFVKDINKSKVIRAQTIMEQASGYVGDVAVESLPKVDVDQVVNDLLPIMLESHSPLAVTDTSGDIVGVVTNKGVTATLWQ